MELSPRCTRRALARLAVGAISALPLVFRQREASALTRGWCKRDPIVRIGHQRYHLWVHLWAKNDRAADRMAKGPIAVVFKHPLEVALEILDDSKPAFGGHGWDVSKTPFQGLEVQRSSSRTVRIRVRVPTRGRRKERVMIEMEPLPDDHAAPMAAQRASAQTNNRRVTRRAQGKSNGWVELVIPADEVMGIDEPTPTDEPVVPTS